MAILFINISNCEPSLIKILTEFQLSVYVQAQQLDRSMVKFPKFSSIAFNSLLHWVLSEFLGSKLFTRNNFSCTTNYVKSKNMIELPITTVLV